MAFSERNSILDSIVSPESTELWMRILVVVLLIANTGADKAVLIAEKLRKEIEETKFNTVKSVTASFGHYLRLVTVRSL